MRNRCHEAGDDRGVVADTRLTAVKVKVCKLTAKGCAGTTEGKLRISRSAELDASGDQAHETRKCAINAVGINIHDTVSRRITGTHPNTTKLVVSDEDFCLTGLQIVTTATTVGSAIGVRNCVTIIVECDLVLGVNLHVGIDLAACMETKTAGTVITVRMTNTLIMTVVDVAHFTGELTREL